MKVKRKEHNALFRGLLILMAFTLSVLCFPANSIVAFADEETVGDYHVLTIGNSKEEVPTVVNKGGVYKIPNAYIGGSKKLVIGDESIKDKTVQDKAENTATIKGSKVTLSLLGKDLTSTIQQNSFTANEVGTYVITYSYQYQEGDGEVVENSYQLRVTSTLSSAAFNFVDTSVAMPSLIDLYYAKSGETYKDLQIVLPEIQGEDGEAEEDVQFYANTYPTDAAAKFVVVTVNGGTNASTLKARDENQNETDDGSYFLKKKDGTFVVRGDVFKDPLYGAGKYVVKYAYYVRNLSEEGTPVGEAHFVTSTTKEIQVYPDGEKPTYYTDYKLNLKLASDWVDNGQTGVESTLPVAQGVTSTETNPASEAVDVAYSVKVYYKKNLNDKYDKDLTQIDGKALYADVVNEDGTLKDPTKFTPLEDGFYSFEYTITDFYGNKVTSDKLTYQFTNNNSGVKDLQAPTPIVYDASVYAASDDYKDEVYKTRRYAPASGVIVYAIGMKDNHSKYNTEGVEMERRIITDEDVLQMTIKDYDEFNLVFNYTGWKALRDNNYYLRLDLRHYVDAENKQIISDQNEENNNVKMLAYLASHGYKIVVDNANYKSLFTLFNAEGYFADKNVTTEAQALEWFKTEDAVKAGFAYLNEDKTFGASESNNGFGLDQYVIEYVVKDAAGNEATHKEVDIEVVSSNSDDTAPTITFSTSLKDAYQPTAKVTFNAPTASDNYDTRIYVRTMYRYLDEKGTPIALKKTDANENRETVNLSDLWLDIADDYDDNSVKLTEKYKAYHADDKDGYLEITDTTASTYTIDLSEAKDYAVEVGNVKPTATSLQIAVFVYDDNGNAGVYFETVEISNSVDKIAPSLVEVEDPYKDEDAVIYRGEEVLLPTLTFADDAVEFMDYNIEVNYLKEDAKVPAIEVVGDYQSRDTLSLTYTVHGGSFVASHAGNYQVAVSVKDSRENTVVYFKHYTVESRMIIEAPSISSALPKSQTIELEGGDGYDPKEGIEIPAPTLKYDIPDSVTKDVFDANPTDYQQDGPKYDTTKYVILGVDQNGKVDNYSTTYGGRDGFKPTKARDYEIVYTVNLRVYNYKYFTLQGPTYVENPEGEPVYTEGGYLNYSYNGNKTAKVYFEDAANTLRVVDNDGVTTYTVEHEDNVVRVYKDGQLIENPETTDDFFKADSKNTVPGKKRTVLDDFREVWNYQLTSETYLVKVQDTTAPVLADYNYQPSYSVKELDEIIARDGGLKLKGIQVVPNALGIDDVDVDNCKIVVTWRLADGSTGRKEFAGAEAMKEDILFEDFPKTNDKDGIYKITYTVVDYTGNRDESHVYEIAVGDNTAPTIVVPDEFVADSYEIGMKEPLKVDLSKLTISDANTAADYEFVPTATLVNTSTGKEVEAGEGSGNKVYFYDLNEVGSYTLTIEVEDAVGNTATKTINFEVTAKTQDATRTYEIIGIVLIVVSVLILAGVIIYFIVSKVKLDKELKK